MKVNADSHDPVEVKPGSKVKCPVSAYSFRTSITLGPMVPSITGSLTECPVASLVSVKVAALLLVMISVPCVSGALRRGTVRSAGPAADLSH